MWLYFEANKFLDGYYTKKKKKKEREKTNPKLEWAVKEKNYNYLQQYD